MPRAKTSSFVTEVELLPTGWQAKKLRSKFEAARQVYNACLGEALKRLRCMRQSRLYQKARKTKEKKERNSLFKEAREKHRFREYDLHHWATQFTKSWINEHIKSKSVEAVASAAFAAAEKLSFDPRIRIRFRRKEEHRAVDGKVNSDCRWKGDHVRWTGLDIRARIDTDDPVIAHGLQCDVKYVRVVRRVIRGHERFFAQLVCKGEPYRKPSHHPGVGTVGLDIGTQTIAYVGEGEAAIEVFCQELERDDKRIRRVQRAMNRSQLANNPDNYNEDGTTKPRNQRKEWHKSGRYCRLQRRRAELLRKESAYRKNLHGQLVARVLNYGADVRTEKLNYQTWARRKKNKQGHKKKSFGRSIGKRAPGAFLLRLKQQLEKWEGTLTEFSTKTTRLSQTCHCGYVAKKSLGQRWHKCSRCGVTAQRDLYSAFLARFVEGDQLKADQAQEAWSSTCAALESALSTLNKDANGSLPSSLGLTIYLKPYPLLPCLKWTGFSTPAPWLGSLFWPPSCPS